MDSVPLMKGSCSQISNISLAIICSHLIPSCLPLLFLLLAKLVVSFIYMRIYSVNL